MRSAVHPSLSNQVFMVASEPDLPERAGRRSIWTGKIGDKGTGKNKGKDKGKQGKKGRKGPPEPPWRRSRSGKGKAARAGAEPAAPEPEEPEEQNEPEEPEPSLPEEEPEIRATSPSPAAAVSEADWSPEEEAQPASSRGPDVSPEREVVYTAEEKKQDFRAESAEESDWGPWQSARRVVPREPSYPPPQGSQRKELFTRTQKGWKDNRRSQEARHYRILKGLIKLANKKGEKVPREVEIEVQQLNKRRSTSLGERPWKKQRQAEASTAAPKPLLRHLRLRRRVHKGLGLGRKSAPAGLAEVLSEVEGAAKALGRKITVHRRVQELAVARVKRGAATPETALASNYRLRRAAVSETLFLTKAKGSVEVPIAKAVLGLDGLSVPCSSCDERNTSARPAILARAAALFAGVGDSVLGPSPKLPAIWKSPPPKAKAPAVQPEEPSKPKASKPKEELPKKEKKEPQKKEKEEPPKKEKEEPQKKKVKSEPKEETRVILKEAPKPQPPPPSPSLSEASVHFHDRAEPDSGSCTYYTDEEESKSD